MSIINSVNRILDTLDTITPTQWAGGIQTVLKDVKASASTEQEILDGIKILAPEIPGLGIIADLAEIYFAAGGQPAPNSALVFQRKDPDDMDRDV